MTIGNNWQSHKERGGEWKCAYQDYKPSLLLQLGSMFACVRHMASDGSDYETGNTMFPEMQVQMHCTSICIFKIATKSSCVTSSSCSYILKRLESFSFQILETIQKLLESGTFLSGWRLLSYSKIHMSTEPDLTTLVSMRWSSRCDAQPITTGLTITSTCPVAQFNIIYT